MTKPTIGEILKTHWGYEKFRPMQADIINTVLSGSDCLALLPTGGGKSLCFQVPALAMDGLCLVISPLIALMKDQVTNLRKKNITAFSIHAGLTRSEVKQTLEVAGKSNCKFLYVSPERLETHLFKEYLPSLNVQLIAVDEAHCISQWGYDFRPSYLRIASIRNELSGVPVLALTASATEKVQNDICDRLGFAEKKIFRQSFERPNLSYSVFQVSSKINKIVDVLQKVNGTGIVYCRSRKRTKELSDLLNMNGIDADYYHAGLSQDERNERQEAWLQNRVRVIVCTNAFGMGIDKPDVRIVVHADVPDCLENYYQEAGRAGRDGKRCYAVLLYTDKELQELADAVEARFPPLTTIRDVYGKLMNFLQVPAHSGENNYYEFDLTAFVRSFKISMNETLAVLKILEQEEMLYFNEQVFLPSKVQVLGNRERLFELEKENEPLDRVIKTLLRSYEGIMDQPTSIVEHVVANSMREHVDKIKTYLLQLHHTGVINYVPQKDRPQVYFCVNRVPAADLHINQEKLQTRKKNYEERAREMIRFVESSTTCRSTIIGNYFGDAHMKSCGICDNCLRRKKEELTRKSFKQIEEAVVNVMRSSPSSISEIIAKVKGVPKEKTREVLLFMQSEEMIDMDENGKLRLRES